MTPAFGFSSISLQVFLFWCAVAVFCLAVDLLVFSGFGYLICFNAVTDVHFVSVG